MANQQYDNSNKGSLWVPRNENAPVSLSGKGDIAGTAVYLDLYKTDGKKCAAVLIIRRVDDDSNVKVVSVYKSDKGKCIMYGKLPDGAGYVNFVKSEARRENAPVLNLFFNLLDDDTNDVAAKPVSKKAHPQANKSTVQDDFDDIPF